MLKLYELAIDNGDGQPITQFRLATDLDDLKAMVVPVRYSHPDDIIHVWLIENEDTLERSTKDPIEIIGKFSEDVKKDPSLLPAPPEGMFPIEMLGGAFPQGDFFEVIAMPNGQMELFDDDFDEDGWDYPTFIF